jgi:hypothetical protein
MKTKGKKVSSVAFSLERGINVLEASTVRRRGSERIEGRGRVKNPKKKKKKKGIAVGGLGGVQPMMRSASSPKIDFPRG